MYQQAEARARATPTASAVRGQPEHEHDAGQAEGQPGGRGPVQPGAAEATAPAVTRAGYR